MLKVFFLIHRLTLTPSRRLETGFQKRTYVTRHRYSGIYVVQAGHYLSEFELPATEFQPLTKATITRNLCMSHIYGTEIGQGNVSFEKNSGSSGIR